MHFSLRSGHGRLALSLPGRKVIDILEGPEIPPLELSRLQALIAAGIRSWTPTGAIGRRITVIVPDNTRLWARGDALVPVIIDTLLDMGARPDQLTILIALGTHADIPKSGFPALIGKAAATVRVCNSANRNRERLVRLGATSRGTPVDLTIEACEADHVIVFGGVLHHLIAGFGGGRKYILPGIAGFEAVQHNHSLALADGTTHPGVGQAQLRGNPVHEDLEEALDIFSRDRTMTYAAVVANGRGELCWGEVGPMAEVFARGCAQVNQAGSVPIGSRGDFALTSAGGHRVDGQLYQATKALFNAANAVRPGGRILLVAEAAEGVGNNEFARLLREHHHAPRAIAASLDRNFSMPAYVAFRVADLQQRFTIHLASTLPDEECAALGFHPFRAPEQYLASLQGCGYIIPHGENVLPLPRAATEQPS